MTTDLHAIIGAALPSQRQIDTALENGIDAQAMISAGGFGIASVTFVDDTFEFDGGTKAMIIPVYDHPDLIEIVDLVAVDARRPARFARFLKRGWALGEHWLNSPWQAVEPMIIRRTPLRWLKEGAEGLVILDWTTAREELQHVDTIIAEDLQHGREIRRLMQHPPWRGKVMVPKPESMVAA